MAPRIIVSNSTPLINFATINEINILRELFKQILIPKAVWHEVVTTGWPDTSENIEKSEWIVEGSISDLRLSRTLERELDKGEAEAIVLAIEVSADLILLDELEARNIADMQGLNYMGSIGCLALAKRIGLIDEIKPLLDKMIDKARFWVNKELYSYVLINNQEV
jgi:predicted nucleic acid-binding protein